MKFYFNMKIGIFYMKIHKFITVYSFIRYFLLSSDKIQSLWLFNLFFMIFMTFYSFFKFLLSIWLFLYLLLVSSQSFYFSFFFSLFPFFNILYVIIEMLIFHVDLSCWSCNLFSHTNSRTSHRIELNLYFNYKFRTLVVSFPLWILLLRALSNISHAHKSVLDLVSRGLQSSVVFNPSPPFFLI